MAQQREPQLRRARDRDDPPAAEQRAHARVGGRGQALVPGRRDLLERRADAVDPRDEARAVGRDEPGRGEAGDLAARVAGAAPAAAASRSQPAAPDAAMRPSIASRAGSDSAARTSAADTAARRRQPTTAQAASSEGAYVGSRSSAWRIPSPRIPASPREAPSTTQRRSWPLAFR